MIIYLFSISLPVLAVLGGVVLTHGRYEALRTSEWIAIVATLIVVPMLASILAVRLIQIRTPRRWLHPGWRRKRKLLIVGFIAGVGSVALTALGVSIVNRDEWYELSGPGAFAPSDVLFWSASDYLIPGDNRTEWWDYGWYEARDRIFMRSPIGPGSMITGVSTFLSTLIFTGLMPRRRAGLCARCGYDIRYSLDSGRCPECGTAISPA